MLYFPSEFSSLQPRKTTGVEKESEKGAKTREDRRTQEAEGVATA